MTQEVERELARHEIPGGLRVATSENVVDCILFKRKSYSLRLSTRLLAVVNLVEDPYGAGGDNIILEAQCY